MLNVKRIRILSKAYQWLKKNDHAVVSLFFSLVLAVLLVNAFHEMYPDEFDNILGGWYITHGVPIYTGFFTHHGPVAYFISAVITLVTQNSFVAFRIAFAILVFSHLVWSYVYLRRKVGKDRSVFYLVFVGIIALAGNYYWLHMILADTLAAYFLAPVIALLLISSYFKLALTRKDMIVISLLTSMTVLSSLTFLFLSILIYLYSCYFYLRSNSIKIFSRRTGELALIFLAPYFVFFVYLVATASLKEYIYQGWVFNQKYYVYNYPRPDGVTRINPIRYAVVIANTFYNSYFTLLEQVKTLNIGFPLNITLASGTFGTALYFFIKKRYLFATTFLGFLIYANSRSDPLNSKETDYQSAVYIMIAFIVIPFILIEIFRKVDDNKRLGERIVSIVLFLTIGFYALFSSLFLFQKFFNRTYEKYMGYASLIYDRPEIAPVINKIVDVNEPVWIGPFEFRELLYVHGKPASQYQIFIPGMGYSPEIRGKFIQDFEKSKPSIIYFQKTYFILGRSPETYGQFFLDYLNSHYITLFDYRDNGIRYRSTVAKSDTLDLEGRLYIRKEKARDVIRRMLDQKLVYPSSEE
ncbi:MAG: hypothetical protein HZC02_04450 [Candidatus Levybacteria bacterium]|nr:hypothetical protein [Candidatus Levybacteria bacterium]